MTMVCWHTCGVTALDDPPLFSLPKIKVADTTCAHLVEPKEYYMRCQFVLSPHVWGFSSTDESCPHMREAIAARSDWRLGPTND
jgi:hypothetical protein